MVTMRKFEVPEFTVEQKQALFDARGILVPVLVDE